MRSALHRGDLGLTPVTLGAPVVSSIRALLMLAEEGRAKSRASSNGAARRRHTRQIGSNACRDGSPTDVGPVDPPTVVELNIGHSCRGAIFGGSTPIRRMRTLMDQARAEQTA